MLIGQRDVAISRPEKVLFPEEHLTKADLVEHYRRVADVILRHLRGRPLSLRRYPDGIDDSGFFQKEAADYFPDWIDVVDIPLREDGTAHQVVCSDAETLVYLANQATIEFHVWPSTVDSLENPDRMVIDIDPPDGSDVGELRSVARRLRDLFESVGLAAFVQATGGRGFHVVAPLDGSADYESVRALARDMSDRAARDDPERLTTAFRKERRGNRIFLDTNRNGYAQTFIAPYSLRARAGAPCAVPLDWKELGKAVPNGWDPARLARRLSRKSDPWADISDNVASADQALAKLQDGTSTA